MEAEGVPLVWAMLLAIVHLKPEGDGRAARGGALGTTRRQERSPRTR